MRGGAGAVLFDAVGTLLHARPRVAEIYSTVGRRYGIELSEAEIAERFARAFARQEHVDRRWMAGRTSHEREVARWRHIVRQVFGRQTAHEAMFAELWGHFGSAGSWQLDPAAEPMWRRLTKAGYVLGIASNFDGRLLEICRRVTPLAECPRIFVSSELGWKKPSLGFFRTIEERLGLPADRITLVGDDVENDYRAARAAGWQALLIDPASSRPEQDTIASLDALPQRLR